MKAWMLLLTILIAGQVSNAKLSCHDEELKFVVGPTKKRVVLTKNGVQTRLKILHPANHGFQLFGKTSQAYEVEDGYIVGIKDTKDSKRKDLSVFKGGSVVASFEGCAEK